MAPVISQSSSSSSTERDALLSRRQRARQARQGSSLSNVNVTREDDGTDEPLDDGRSAVSDLSHVLLDAVPTYSRFVWSHVMSLLPCIALLLATVMLAWHAPCHIHQAPIDRTEERRTCSRLLSDRVSLAAFGIGVVCWLAAYAIRPAIWKTIELGSSLARISELGSGTLASGSVTFLFVLLRTTMLELLRLFSVLLGNAMIFAGLIKIPGLDKDIFHAPDTNPGRPYRWILHWYDPRFTIAVWVAIGWAVTEFFVTSWQMFDRIALYEVDFDDDALPVEGDVEDEAGGSVPRMPHLSDSDAGQDYSDSAATVRAQSNVNLPANDQAAKAESAGATGSISPSTRLLDARRRVLAAAEESGFSIARSDAPDDEAEELGVLREKLDAEMEGLAKARTRVELESTFGQPLTSVPIVLCTLWRIDGWLWNLGSTLLMSASVTLAQGPLTGQDIPPLFPPLHLTLTTLLTLVALHTIVTTMWTTALPTFGFAFVTYSSMLAGMGLCVSASARWGLLI